MTREKIYEAFGWVGGIYLAWTLVMIPVRREEHRNLECAISKTEEAIEKHDFSLAMSCINDVRALVDPGDDESPKNGWPYSD